MPAAYVSSFEIPVYTSLLVPLDHTDGDRAAVAHAAAIAREHHAKIYLLHIEEDVTSQVYGSMSSTAEVERDRQYLDNIAEALRAQGVEVEALVAYSSSPRKEIVRQVQVLHPDLLIMGAHGHRGLKDLIFGTTINAVRHEVKVPLLVVKEEPRHSS